MKQKIYYHDKIRKERCNCCKNHPCSASQQKQQDKKLQQMDCRTANDSAQNRCQCKEQQKSDREFYKIDTANADRENLFFSIQLKHQRPVNNH